MTNKGIGNIKDYTPHFKLIIPRFNAATWHDFIESNFRSIDALLFNMFGINNFVGEWKQITTYNVGDVVFIGEDLLENETNSEYSGRLVKVLKQHTTDDSAYFNIFYKNHPDYYELFFDANNAEYFSEKAFEYKNEANNYLKASQELNALYQQYLADTQTARDNAQTSANSAATSEQNAKTASETAVNTVKTATDLLSSTQDYTNQAINTINTTKTEAVNTITTTKNQTIQEIDTKLEETNQIIDEKITTVQDNLDTTITEAIIGAKDEVHAEADKAIENAAEEAASFAKNLLDDYVIETVEPSLQHFVDEAETAQDNAITAQNNAQTSATASANSATKALSSENNAKTSENNAESYYNNAKEQADFAKNSADLAQDALKSITGVYRVKGSVASYTNLPISGDVGDVYNVLDTGSNYVWTDSGWDKLSETVDVSWGSISGTLSNQTDLQQALDGKVNTTGNQNVAGIKTFTGRQIVQSFASDSGGNGFKIQDSNNKGYVALYEYITSDGAHFARLLNNSYDKNAYIDIQTNADGNRKINLRNADSAEAPTPETNDNSNKIATTANVDAKITAQAVKLTGDQIIGGMKTFTTPVVFQRAGSGSGYYLKNTNLDALTNPTENQSQYIVWQDKNGKDMSYVSQSINTSGLAELWLTASTYKTDGTRVQGNIRVAADRNGNVWTVAPTPATADNSTKIATTSYVKAQIQEVSAAPSSPVSGVLYVIPE